MNDGERCSWARLNGHRRRETEVDALWFCQCIRCSWWNEHTVKPKKNVFLFLVCARVCENPHPWQVFHLLPFVMRACTTAGAHSSLRTRLPLHIPLRAFVWAFFLRHSSVPFLRLRREHLLSRIVRLIRSKDANHRVFAVELCRPLIKALHALWSEVVPVRICLLVTDQHLAETA